MKHIVIFCLILFSISGHAMKGRLLLVGGGSEQTGGWSNAPYKWGVDHAANKKVAIISYDVPPSNFLSNYFTANLGAVRAKDFNFSTKSIADSQSTYDSLMTYDMIFFRGGDQSQYYSLYKGTKLVQAINDKFNNGGVIAGTSAGLHVLSGVVYTARYQSLSSVDAIKNITSTSFTLDNDLFNLFPDYVFDSHVAERGRFARTVSFLANYFITHNKKINAVAVDDLTAMGIDTNEVGTAFGTGAIGIYKITSKYTNPFIIDGQKPLSDFVSVSHLLNTWRYNFKTHSIEAFKSDTATLKPIKLISSNPTKSTVLLSGDDTPAANVNLINQLIDSTGQVTDSILIISHTTASPAYAVDFVASITGGARAKAIVFNTNGQAVGDTSLRTFIKLKKKILFTGNSTTLYTYLTTDTAYGSVILSTIKKQGVVVAFVGKAARLAGKSVVNDNYLTTGDAAYYAELSSYKGLNLIPNSLILPYAFYSVTDDGYFENQACAVPYFMMRDTCRFGIMLSGDMVVKYGLSNSNRYFNANGSIPAIIYKCDSTQRAFSTTTSKNSGSPRQVAGFSQMQLALLGALNPYFIDEGIAYKDTLLYARNLTTGVASYNQIPNTFTLYPNPTTSYINMNMETNSLFPTGKVELIDFNGKKVYESNDPSGQIPVSGLPKGIYIVKIETGERVYTNKIVIGETSGE